MEGAGRGNHEAVELPIEQVRKRGHPLAGCYLHGRSGIDLHRVSHRNHLRDAASNQPLEPVPADPPNPEKIQPRFHMSTIALRNPSGRSCMSRKAWSSSVRGKVWV